MGFNKFPFFLDKFTSPPGGGWGVNTPENIELYLRHCLPTIQQIVDKVMEVQKVSKGLRRIFIMTNAQVPWLQDLKAELMKAYQWDQVSSSRDLNLNWEQKYVAQAVDMMIGERAQVFIGNGVRFFSSCARHG